MKILVIEDDENKRQQLVKFLESINSHCQLTIQTSYNSALKSVLSKEKWNLILLDMTMPTYDISLNEDGGRPQHYAGRAILRQMKRHSIKTPVIVVTQFDVFGEGTERMTRDELDKQLQSDHPKIYLGMVYYNAAVDGWKNELNLMISQNTSRLEPC